MWRTSVMPRLTLRDDYVTWRIISAANTTPWGTLLPIDTRRIGRPVGLTLRSRWKSNIGADGAVGLKEVASLRIVLIGQAAFAAKALETIQTRGDQIVHVFAPPDSAEGRADPLKTKSLEIGIPVSQPSSFRSDAAYKQFESLEADLAVMAFVTLIVPERILYAPRHKSICFHPSLLPRHRGASAIAWTLIQGDRDTGVTWFWPDKGIDTGPILIQRRVPVGINDTTGSLYFNTLFPLGIETLRDA